MRLARWLVVLVVMLAAPRFAVAQQPAPILPLNQVRPGLKGYGLSVFRGTRIEKFDVTIIDVLRGIDFEMDMVLIRLDSGPAVDERWGIIEGMSGSPIYTQDGRLIGALAYGWEFQIEPIAGVTPIEQMIEQFDPRHPIAQAYAERRDTEQRRDPRRQETAQTGALWPRHGPLEVAGRPVRSVELARNDDDARLMARRQAGAGVLKPLATPVMVSGMGMRGMRLLEDLLAPHNLRPVQAGGVRADTDTAYEFKPGAAVSVPLITGDISLEGVGTVTYVDDDMVLAFGHPMMSLGAVDMPMDVAYIHQIIGGQVSSFKLGGGIATVGRLTQDRPTCVGGRLGERADILPATFSLTQPDRGVERRFDLFVSRFPMANRYLAGMLATAIENVAGSDFDGVIHADLALLAREVGEGTDASAGEGDETAEPTEPGEPLRIVRSNSFDTKAGSAFGVNPTADLLTTLLLLETNPFGEAEVERLAVDVRFVQDRSFATIERAAAD